MDRRDKLIAVGLIALGLMAWTVGLWYGERAPLCVVGVLAAIVGVLHFDAMKGGR